jgi:hypothetical protein
MAKILSQMETGQLSYSLANAGLESLGSSANVIQDIHYNLADRAKKKLFSHYDEIYSFDVECMDSENVRYVTETVKDIIIKSSLVACGLDGGGGGSGPSPPHNDVRSKSSEFKIDISTLNVPSAPEVLHQSRTTQDQFHVEQILEEFKGSRSVPLCSEDEPVLSKSQRRFEDLIQLQRYDGSWEPSNFVLKCITELHLDHPKDNISGNQTEPQKLALLQAIFSDSSCLATYCCLMLLLNCFQDQFQEIRMMIQKGIRFLLQKCNFPSNKENDCLLRSMLQDCLCASNFR